MIMMMMMMMMTFGDMEMVKMSVFLNLVHGHLKISKECEYFYEKSIYSQMILSGYFIKLFNVLNFKLLKLFHLKIPLGVKSRSRHRADKDIWPETNIYLAWYLFGVKQIFVCSETY